MNPQDRGSTDAKSAEPESHKGVLKRLPNEPSEVPAGGQVQDAATEPTIPNPPKKRTVKQPPSKEDTPVTKPKSFRVFRPEKSPEHRVTGTLKEEDAVLLQPEVRRALPQTGNLYGCDLGKPAEYLRLPVNAVDAEHSLPCWQIELREITTTAIPIGIELLGDVVLGIDRDDDFRPDLDLSAYDAYQRGVSRRHAMLRPTRNRIYLLDLQSLNGTMHNALPLIPGHAPELRNGDIITLGSLSFSFRIVSGPGVAKK